MSNLPSVKTLSLIAHDRAVELRKVLEITTREELESMLLSEQGESKYPVTYAWYRSGYHPMTMLCAKMSIASDITGCHGVEYQRAGKGSRSPAFEYVNAGDAYASTLLYIYGRGYRVACWGDIVERGDYRDE
jgi:hypothetical protein